jgi:hypothetical protein
MVGRVGEATSFDYHNGGYFEGKGMEWLEGIDLIKMK